MKNKFCILLLLLTFTTLKLFAVVENEFKCNKKGIPANASGTYKIDYAGKLTYKTLREETVDINVIPQIPLYENIKLSKLEIYRDNYNLYGNNFYEFDAAGNLYFISTFSFKIIEDSDFHLDYKEIKDITVLYKFNPLSLTTTYKLLNPNTIPHSFCLSDDGKWSFIDLLEDTDGNNNGYPAIYVISTDFNEEPEKLYSSSYQENAMTRNIRNLCFDSNTKNLYFSLSKNENSEFDGLFGFAVDSNLLYTKSTLFTVSSNINKSCKLYSNKQGLWGVCKNDENDSESVLVHILDESGNPVKKQNKNISKVKIAGNWRFSPSMFFEDSLILYLNADKSKIFNYENDVITDVSHYINKNGYTNNDLETVSELIQNERYIIEADNVFLNKTVLMFIYIIIAVLTLIIVALVIVIFQLCNKNNQFKKNKQFIFNIQETERGKISRDIHDSIIQDIRAIRIKAELLKVDSESENNRDDVIRLATDCVVKLRNICYNLTPAELATHEDGDSSKIELISIIQSLVLQFIERTHVPCQLKIDENFEYPVLDKETSQNLFRIIQESLTNIEKHSYATQCQIWIRNKVLDEKKGMLIFISDDGVGCDIKNIRKKNGKYHFGLQNIVDRATLIGGTAEFESEPGQGFEVTITV